MSSADQFRNKWLAFTTLCLVTLGLVVYPAPALYAQDTENGDGSPASTAADDAFLWEESSEPYIEKSEGNITYPDDDKEIKQFEHSLFLPSAGTDINAQATSTHATWQTIHLQTFEGTFPPLNSNWAIRDHNGPNVGVPLNEFATLVWDDNSTRAYQGSWSANPNDGAWAPTPGALRTYANHTDTWMRYGPFSLVGATDAKFDLWYWLDTETYYDYFGIEYSCNMSSWYGVSVSGSFRVWNLVSTPLTKCLGKSTVYIRITFKSDYSNPSNPVPTGVWVDNIKIEKLQ